MDDQGVGETGVKQDTTYARYAERVASAMANVNPDALAKFIEMLRSTSDGDSVYTIGNGGSAATASHLAGDLYTAYSSHGAKTAVRCLSDHVVSLTALANDYDFAEVWSRPVYDWTKPGDLLTIFSVSGTSTNLVAAALAAKRTGCRVASFLACDGGDLLQLSEVAILVNTRDYGIAEGVHACLAHYVAEQLRGRTLEVLSDCRASATGLEPG